MIAAVETLTINNVKTSGSWGGRPSTDRVRVQVGGCKEMRSVHFSVCSKHAWRSRPSANYDEYKSKQEKVFLGQEDG